MNGKYSVLTGDELRNLSHVPSSIDKGIKRGLRDYKHAARIAADQVQSIITESIDSGRSATVDTVSVYDDQSNELVGMHFNGRIWYDTMIEGGSGETAQNAWREVMYIRKAMINARNEATQFAKHS